MPISKAWKLGRDARTGEVRKESKKDILKQYLLGALTGLIVVTGIFFFGFSAGYNAGDKCWLGENPFSIKH